jgi:hypothetical protein
LLGFNGTFISTLSHFSMHGREISEGNCWQKVAPRMSRSGQRL